MTTPTTPRTARQQPEPLLPPSKAAAAIGVDPKTLTRWQRAGKVRTEKTIGGHRRYRLSELREDVAKARAEKDTRG